MRQRRQNRQFYNQEGFVYNPGDDIRRNLAISAKGIDDATKAQEEHNRWTYGQIKETKDNIDKIAESFSELHSDILNQEVAGIEGAMSASILENGKLDYSQLGAVNKAVRGLKTMQNNSQGSIAAYKNAVELMNSNPAYMIDPVATQLEMKKLLQSKEALLDPSSLGKKIDDLYRKGVNYNKKIMNTIALSVKETAGKGRTEIRNYTNEAGDTVSQEVTIHDGVTFWNEDTNKLEQVMIKAGDSVAPVGALDANNKSLLGEEEFKGVMDYVIGADQANGVTLEKTMERFSNAWIQNNYGKSQIIQTAAEKAALARKVRIENENQQFKRNKDARDEAKAGREVEQFTLDQKLKNANLARIQATTRKILQDTSLDKEGKAVELRLNGVEIDENGDIVYNPEGDILQKNRIELKKTASTVNNSWSAEEGEASIGQQVDEFGIPIKN